MPGQAWNLKQLTLAAFYYKPQLAEARAQLMAVRAGELSAGERPNPSLTLSPGYDSQIPGTPTPWIVPLTMDWPIETAGKRGYRMANARHLAEAARWNLIGVVWGVRSGVRAALLGLYSARQTEALLARQVMAQTKVVQMLEGQAGAGVVSSYEVTQARIALDTLILARQATAGEYAQARVTMANALGVPTRALEGVNFSFAAFKTFPRRLSEPQVRQRALLNRADVRGGLAEYAASQSALQLQIAGQYPDIHLGPGYAYNSGSAGDNQWSIGLTLTLPILNQNQGAIAQAKANRKLAAAHFLSIQSAAISRIESALTAYRWALQGVATARVLVKNLKRQLALVRGQVQAGEAQPLDLANAQVAFNAGARGQLNAVLKAQQALGGLEAAVQSPLTLSTSKVDAGETAHATDKDLKR
ncbi:MAG: TolC family protein [Syntrophobacteraceae bacterium]